jgi:N-acetylglutamate synthase-like GNAT family acetyltransferase
MKKILFLIVTLFINSLFANATIRMAHASEIDWINSKYDEINFMHSDFNNEIIAIAEVDGIPAGIGRLVKIDISDYELGGMYVFEDYRNNKIASHIVQFLLTQLDHAKNYTVYCIPFAGLSFFYQRFGFKKVIDFERVPQKIIRKYRWCQQTYSDPVDLLVIT